jgi:hypothetical protein
MNETPMSETLAIVGGIAFDPLLPWPWIAALALIALALFAFGLGQGARGTWWRAGAAALAIAALADPALMRERREPMPSVAALVVDRSPSQTINDRLRMAEEAAALIRAQAGRLAGIDLRTVIVEPQAGADALGPGTRLFTPLERLLADVPRDRFAGAIMITEGQVHDAPGDAKSLKGPLHVLLTGNRGERDRRLVIEQAPAFAIVGRKARVTLKVEDSDPEPGATAEIILKPVGGAAVSRRVPVGESANFDLAIDRPGLSQFEIEIQGDEPELTLRNNRAVLAVNGVRDRLKVLLISGQPHAGERIWRNLLKADAAIDLVHFTILRPPEKEDGTPVRELALIGFPITDLFEVKLKEFDLIIFDHNPMWGVLPSDYFENIVRYVHEGGAVLEASGPGFAGPSSLYRTPLGAVLPGRPTARVHVAAFKPYLSETGRRHPVTAGLPGADPAKPAWGRWLRMVDVDGPEAAVVMTGNAGRPLLLLQRAGLGRVAQLTSDQAWLWARGFEGGGPQAELLRRLAHWLMREPELEERDLKARVLGLQIEITRQSLTPEQTPIQVLDPDGNATSLETSEATGGQAKAVYTAPGPGIYRISDGERETVALVGGGETKEFTDVRATEEILAPVAATSNGSIHWIDRSGVPDLRLVDAGERASGRGWIGLRKPGAFKVLSLEQWPLLPALAVLSLLLGLLMLAWHREGR